MKLKYASIGPCKYVTVHAKTFRKSANIFFEIRADFASPIFSLPILQISCG